MGYMYNEVSIKIDNVQYDKKRTEFLEVDRILNEIGFNEIEWYEEDDNTYLDLRSSEIDENYADFDYSFDDTAKKIFMIMFEHDATINAMIGCSSAEESYDSFYHEANDDKYYAFCCLDEVYEESESLKESYGDGDETNIVEWYFDDEKNQDD